MLEVFKLRGENRMVHKLAAAPVTTSGGTPRAYLAVRDRAMHRLGVGTTRDMTSVLSGIFWPSITSSAYTPAEKVRLWRGKLATGVSALWDEMLAADLAELVPELSLPAYFFHGIHDYTVNYQLAQEYATHLRAPLKGFYTFPESAHSPVFEEPQRARRILREDVLAEATDLADDLD